MPDIKAEIKGLKETQKRMERIVRDLAGGPFLDGMRKATLLVQGAARVNAPVDTGRLRASITPQVVAHSGTVQGIVGSNVEYAPKMELPGNVRRTGRRPYLEPALTENADKVYKILGDTVGRIVSD